MRECAGCGETVETRYRYCPWCATPQRLKLTEFFLGRDPGKALRVSRYLGPTEAERHVRLSVWDDETGVVRASAALSLEEDEADRLARFLANAEAPTEPIPLV